MLHFKRNKHNKLKLNQSLKRSHHHNLSHSQHLSLSLNQLNKLLQENQELSKKLKNQHLLLQFKPSQSLYQIKHLQLQSQKRLQLQLSQLHLRLLLSGAVRVVRGPLHGDGRARGDHGRELLHGRCQGRRDGGDGVRLHVRGVELAAI